MGLTKQDLTNTFTRARETDASYVFVAVVAEGTEEVITIPKRSFDAKEAFYARIYNDDLVHGMNSQVYIRGLSFGEAEELKNFA